jgi:hypothetical protein
MPLPETSTGKIQKFVLRSVQRRPFSAAQKKGGRSRPLIGYARITGMGRS